MASTAVAHAETYSADDATGVAKLHDFLAAHRSGNRDEIEPRYFLAGASVGDQVELPEEFHRILLQVVEAMHKGLAVTVSPQAKQLTTQQAAELLNVSRPTLIKMLDSGELAFTKAGTHRRVRLDDVLAYREQRRRAQYAALDALYADDDGDHAVVLEELKTVRKAVAARRRG